MEWLVVLFFASMIGGVAYLVFSSTTKPDKPKSSYRKSKMRNHPISKRSKKPKR